MLAKAFGQAPRCRLVFSIREQARSHRAPIDAAFASSRRVTRGTHVARFKAGFRIG